MHVVLNLLQMPSRCAVRARRSGAAQNGPRLRARRGGGVAQDRDPRGVVEAKEKRAWSGGRFSLDFSTSCSPA